MTTSGPTPTPVTVPVPVEPGLPPARLDDAAPPRTNPAPDPPVSRTSVRPAADADARLVAAWPEVMRDRLRVTRSPANGNRPVAVYVAPGFDPQQPARVVTFFHGHGWDVGPALARHRVHERLAAEAARDPQTVFILPQASNPPPFSSWMKAPESLEGLVAHGLREAGAIVGGEVFAGRRQIDAHSGGGLALANALCRRPSESNAAWQRRLAETDLGSKVNLLDATYGDWGQVVTQWAIARRRVGQPARVESWYTRHQEMVEHNQAMLVLARQASLADLLAVHDVTARLQHNDVVAAQLGSE